MNACTKTNKPHRFFGFRHESRCLDCETLESVVADREQRDAAELHRLRQKNAAVARWHALAVSMGYDGVEPALLSLQAMTKGPRPIEDDLECMPLLHVFCAQGEPCKCGALQWGQPSNTPITPPTW